MGDNSVNIDNEKVKARIYEGGRIVHFSIDNRQSQREVREDSDATWEGTSVTVPLAEYISALKELMHMGSCKINYGHDRVSMEAGKDGHVERISITSRNKTASASRQYLFEQQAGGYAFLNVDRLMAIV